MQHQRRPPPMPHHLPLVQGAPAALRIVRLSQRPGVLEEDLGVELQSDVELHARTPEMRCQLSLRHHCIMRSWLDTEAYLFQEVGDEREVGLHRLAPGLGVLDHLGGGDVVADHLARACP